MTRIFLALMCCCGLELGAAGASAQPASPATPAPATPPPGVTSPTASTPAAPPPAKAAGAQEIVPDSIRLADSLFHGGRFDDAERVYFAYAAAHKDNYRAAFRCGALALMSNRLMEAKGRFGDASRMRPADKAWRNMTAEVYRRMNYLAEAGNLYGSMEQDASMHQFTAFGGRMCYQISGLTAASHIPFVVTEPLPVVRLRINGHGANFLIDTGAAELMIDSSYAELLHVPSYGGDTGTFAGGRTGGFYRSSVDSVQLGDFVVQRVPVMVQDLSAISARAFPGTPINGVLGTVMLYHFLATLDYPKRELVLRPRGGASVLDFEAMATGAGVKGNRFWMAGDHIMVAEGRINQCEPTMWFLDTGLAGGAFDCAQSTIDRCGVQVDEGHAGEGVGGGGAVRVVPIKADRIEFGGKVQKNVRGLHSGPLPLEEALGFHIGGILSHGFLRQYALTLDFENMVFYLQ